MESCFKELEKKNYLICVPSRGRSDLITKKQGLWKYVLSEPNVYSICVFVLEEELEEYGKVLGNRPISLRGLTNGHSIADKRQKMYEMAVAMKKEYLFIIDDDVTFSFRNENIASKYISKFEEVHNKDTFNRILLESVSLCNEKYPITGLPLRQSSNSAKYTFEKNKQLLHMQCYHVPTLIKEGIRHNGLGTKFMSDRYVQMVMMSKGYNTLANYRYCIDDMGTNTKGGCSITRNPKEQSESAKTLYKLFPEIVRLKVKYNGNWSEPRYDCTIFLKKFLGKEEKSFIPKEEAFKMLKENGVSYEL